MIELVQRPADPEILLGIAERRAKPVRGRQEQVPAIGFSRPDDLLVAGAGPARRTLAGVTSSRRKSCIQIGRAARPSFQSLRQVRPGLGSTQPAETRTASCRD